MANSHQTVEQLFDDHSAIVLLINPNTGKIIYANSAALNFYQYNIHQLNKLTIQDINLLSQEQVAAERKAAEQENRNYFVFRHQTALGDKKTVQVFSSPFPLDGKTMLLSIIHDISSQRSLQEELWHYQTNLENMVDKQVNILKKQSEQQRVLMLVGLIFLGVLSTFLVYLLQRKQKAEQKSQTLSQIVEQSPMSIAILDHKGNIRYSNSEFKRQHLQRYHLTDTPANFIDAYRQSHQHLSPLVNAIEQSEKWQGELVSITKDDKECWENTSVYPLSTSAKEASHVVISQDISGKKENEKKLRLGSTVFQTATEAVMVCDTYNQILAVNHAFTKITGFSEQEAVGQNPGILKSGHHDRQFYDEMFIALTNDGQWQGEICNRRKNGEVYYEWLSITALKSPTGELEGYVSLFSDITKRKTAEDKIYHQANFDSLTGLANRNLFADRFKHALSIAERESSQVALIYIDLDGFKHINDTLGHSYGDLLLQKAAKRLTELLRKSDTVTRLGGDEFAVILADNVDIHSIKRTVTRIIDSIALPFDLNQRKGNVTGSVGIAIYPDDGLSVENLLVKADSAMYQAKANGRNNFQFFTKEMDDAAHQRSLLETELRQAVVNEDFVVVYQPIHCTRTNNVTYAEALVRWQHPEKGMISPATFISLAEELELIDKIGDLVLREACIEAANWQTRFPSPPKVAVNVSPKQFQQHGFVDRVKLALAEAKLPANQLILEITESLLIEDDKKVVEQLSKLTQLGVSISIDDFGTGYSSLSYLKRFPVNKLKVDRSFIQSINSQEQDARLINAIVSMAHSLNLEVIAEGVETDIQLSHVKELGCEFAQGFLFSKPIQAKDFEQYLHCLNTVVC